MGRLFETKRPLETSEIARIPRKFSGAGVLVTGKKRRPDLWRLDGVHTANHERGIVLWSGQPDDQAPKVRVIVHPNFVETPNKGGIPKWMRAYLSTVGAKGQFEGDCFDELQAEEDTIPLTPDISDRLPAPAGESKEED